MGLVQLAFVDQPVHENNGAQPFQQAGIEGHLVEPVLDFLRRARDAHVAASSVWQASNDHCLIDAL